MSNRGEVMTHSEFPSEALLPCPVTITGYLLSNNK
jgi:hypothetical protein